MGENVRRGRRQLGFDDLLGAVLSLGILVVVVVGLWNQPKKEISMIRMDPDFKPPVDARALKIEGAYISTGPDRMYLTFTDIIDNRQFVLVLDRPEIVDITIYPDNDE